MKYPFFLSDVNDKFNPEISNFTKIRPVGVKLFHAYGLDRRTDRDDEANSHLLQFCKRT